MEKKDARAPLDKPFKKALAEAYALKRKIMGEKKIFANTPFSGLFLKSTFQMEYNLRSSYGWKRYCKSRIPVYKEAQILNKRLTRGDSPLVRYEDSWIGPNTNTVEHDTTEIGRKDFPSSFHDIAQTVGEHLTEKGYTILGNELPIWSAFHQFDSSKDELNKERKGLNRTAFAGLMDALLMDDTTGALSVIDLKTTGYGTPPCKSMEISTKTAPNYSHFLQTWFYAMILQRYYSVSVERLHVVVYYVNSGHIVWISCTMDAFEREFEDMKLEELRNAFIPFPLEKKKSK